MKRSGLGLKIYKTFPYSRRSGNDAKNDFKKRKIGVRTARARIPIFALDHLPQFPNPVEEAGSVVTCVRLHTSSLCRNQQIPEKVVGLN